MLTGQQIQEYMDHAAQLAMESVESGVGGPFGAIVVKDQQIVGSSGNQVFKQNDPTAHAEMLAIRKACANIKSLSLEGMLLFSSCQPCPMCMAAIFYAEISHVFYSNTNEDARKINVDQDDLLRKINEGLNSRVITFDHIPSNKALEAFSLWANDPKMS